MSSPLFNLPVAQPLDDAGRIMPGCYLRFYASETTDPEDVYSDGELNTTLGSEVTASAAGRFVPIFLDATVAYRIQLYNADNELQFDVDPVFPGAGNFVGEVKMYDGDLADLPAGWVVMNGGNGTIDSRDRFPRGVGSETSLGETGGSATASGTTDSNGAHNHSGATGGTAITEAEMPSHKHVGFTFPATGDDNSQLPITRIGGSDQQSLGDVTISSAETGETGGDDPHDHSIGSDGSHTHSIADVSTIPPFFGVYFIKFIGA